MDTKSKSANISIPRKQFNVYRGLLVAFGVLMIVAAALFLVFLILYLKKPTHVCQSGETCVDLTTSILCDSEQQCVDDTDVVCAPDDLCVHKDTELCDTGYSCKPDDDVVCAPGEHCVAEEAVICQADETCLGDGQSVCLPGYACSNDGEYCEACKNISMPDQVCRATSHLYGTQSIEVTLQTRDNDMYLQVDRMAVGETVYLSYSARRWFLSQRSTGWVIHLDWDGNDPTYCLTMEDHEVFISKNLEYGGFWQMEVYEEYSWIRNASDETCSLGYNTATNGEQIVCEDVPDWESGYEFYIKLKGISSQFSSSCALTFT